MVHRRVLQCGLRQNKEKCLKPGLKCVSRWSSSTVQRERVPESWSSNRETTSSSVTMSIVLLFRAATHDPSMSADNVGLHLTLFYQPTLSGRAVRGADIVGCQNDDRHCMGRVSQPLVFI